MKSKGIDILAFGAHADDVEIGMAGSLAKWASNGKTIVICDLTRAELSSNGTVYTRKEEATQSAHLLGIQERINLELPDRGLLLNEAYIEKITTVIRRFKPLIVFYPYHKDRHPDHGNCANLVREAIFSAGIKKYNKNEELAAHKPKFAYQYMINGFAAPSFVIDITKYMDKKVKSLEAYTSQFTKGAKSVSTPLTEGYIDTVVARDRLFGKEVGVTYAEGFISTKPLLLEQDIFGDGL